MNQVRLFALVSAMIMCYSSASHAIVGAGVHWGFDFGLSMDDVQQEQAFYEGFSDAAEDFLDSIPNLETIAGYSVDEFLELMEGQPIRSGLLPITVSRTDWSRTVYNFGGKVFVDVIPVLDAIELAVNFGVWEYEGIINYPVGPSADIDDPALAEKIQENPGAVTYSDFLAYDSVPITLERLDESFLGLSKTPFVKLQFDLSVRKDIFTLPKRRKKLRVYAGGGVSMIFNTPALTAELVEEVMGETLTGEVGDIDDFAVSGEDLQEKVLSKMIRDFQVPTFGINLLAGTMVKIPIIPVGVYGDLKYTLPFSDLEDAANINGSGLMINLGVTFTL
ncbi:MAG: hypothetical protein ACOC41_01950 [Chitinivibrionales bacterium]